MTTHAETGTVCETDDCERQDHVPEAPATITVTFAGPGMADCNIVASPEVEPAQVYAAAWLFARWANEVRDNLLMQAAVKAQQRQQLLQGVAGDITLQRAGGLRRV